MTLMYVGFVVFILLMLFLDLKVVNRDAHVIKPRESLMFTGVTVLLALGFAAAIYAMYEHDWPAGITETLVRQAQEEVAKAQSVRVEDLPAMPATGHGFDAMVVYLTAWVLEYSLSVDNIFVIAVIFAYFRVPQKYQHRVLFWGILGALIMRGAMIAAGAKLVQSFDWIIYVFGFFLIYTAYKMARSGDEHADPSKSLAVRAASRVLRLTPEFHEERFFVRKPVAPSGPAAAPLAAIPTTTDAPEGPGGIDPVSTGARVAAAVDTAAGRLRLHATPLFLALIVVEFTDVIFAVDSIPAVFGLTQDPFLVFTSNVFAILGLRSLFFAIAAALGSFRYLKVSLVFVLGFIGLKMILHGVVHVNEIVSLVVILLMLLGGVVASLFATAHERRIKRTPIEDLASAFDVTRRNLKRIFIFIIGITVIVLGILSAPIPGPGGIPIIIAGLAVLATEFIWAQILLRRLRKQAAALAQTADFVAQKTSPWVIPPVFLLTAAAVIALAHYGPFDRRMVYLGSLAIWFPLCFWAWRVVINHRRAVAQHRAAVAALPRGRAAPEGRTRPSGTAPVQ